MLLLTVHIEKQQYVCVTYKQLIVNNIYLAVVN